MFVHIAIHYPKPEYAGEVLASMRRVDAAAAGSPGLLQINAWQDDRSDRLVGIALWESKAAFEASVERIFQVTDNDPFDVWCKQPPDVFHLSEPPH